MRQNYPNKIFKMRGICLWKQLEKVFLSETHKGGINTLNRGCFQNIYIYEEGKCSLYLFFVFFSIYSKRRTAKCLTILFFYKDLFLFCFFIHVGWVLIKNNIAPIKLCPKDDFIQLHYDTNTLIIIPVSTSTLLRT